MKSVAGRAWVFGDDVNTDVIHPPEFFSLDPDVVRDGLFHGLDSDFRQRLRPGDVIVGGRNFGCGSSRETSIQSLKLNGIGAVLASDFARIFFRSATNAALPCVRFSDPDERLLIVNGEKIWIDFERCTAETESGLCIELEPPGTFIKSVWDAGGLLEVLKLEVDP